MPEQISRGLASGLTDYWTQPLDIPLFLQRLAVLLPPQSGRRTVAVAPRPPH